MDTICHIEKNYKNIKFKTYNTASDSFFIIAFNKLLKKNVIIKILFAPSKYVFENKINILSPMSFVIEGIINTTIIKFLIDNNITRNVIQPYAWLCCDTNNFIKSKVKKYKKNIKNNFNKIIKNVNDEYKNKNIIFNE